MGRGADSQQESAALIALMRPWAISWGLPGLEEGVRVSFNPRLRRSIGRCKPDAGEVSLHPSLADAPRASLATVLCHELAHIAAFQLYGAVVRPHGDEWTTLVTMVGHRPTTAVRASTLGIQATNAPRATRPTRRRYVHRCPVCHSTRLAGRPVSAWRCAECVAAGLEGRLTITAREDARE
jgi:predicted SprT family Zn-dependent metalloprotease